MSSTTRNSLKLSLLTIFSRILGLIRDHFQAVFFGIGPIAFAWEMAMFLPGVLRNLLIEGGVAQAFIPVYAGSLEGSKKEARRTAGVILSVTFLGIVVITIAAALLSPYLLPAITRQSRAEADFMIQLAWILLLFMLPASLTSILAGIANAHRHFVVPALSPIILNVGLIVGFLSIDTNTLPADNARTLAWFFICTAVIQLLFQYIYVWRKRFGPQISFNINHPVVRRIFQMILPAVLSTAIFHINQMVDIAIASYFIPLEVGAVPALRFAQRLIQLPTGIVGVALSTAILPILARYLEKKNADRQGEAIGAFHFAIFLTVPASLGIFFLGEDIITLLLYGGMWDEHATQVTWQALRFYLLGIPLYSLNKILVSIFFAFKDTKTPLRSTILSTLCNLIMNLIFVQFMQHAGIALSTAITAALHFLQLLFYLRKKHIALPWAPFVIFLKRNIPLWLILFFFLLTVDIYFSSYSDQLGKYIMEQLKATELPRYQALPKVILGVGGGFLLYISMALAMGGKEIEVLRNFFKRPARKSRG